MWNAYLVDRVGWTLIHSVWQLVAITYFVVIVNRLLFRRSAQGRYLVGCLALFTAAIVPGVTFFVFSPPARPFVSDTMFAGSEPQATHSVSVSRQQPESKIADVPAGVSESSRTVSARLTDRAASAASLTKDTDSTEAAAEISAHPSYLVSMWQEQATRWLQPRLSPIVGAWLLGVMLLAARPLFGLYTVHRLRRVGRQPVPEKIESLVCRVGARMQVARPIELAESTLIQVPAVIGFVRPLLLLPATAVTHLTPQQLENVIAHELAHIRRHDYLANLLQTLIETLFFYHPAVWWLSSLVRREREHCCDDVAISVCRDRRAYAKTLVAVEGLRGRLAQPSVAANGGSLLQRIRRIAGQPARPAAMSGLASAIILVTAIIAAGGSLAVATKVDAEDREKPNIRLRLRDPDGNSMTASLDLQSASRGYRKDLPNEMYSSDGRGHVKMHLAPGKHVLVACAHRPNATIIELDVAEQRMRRRVKLNPMPPGYPGKSGYPDLDVKAIVREGKRRGEEIIILTISNNRDKPYKLHRNDLTITNDDRRVFPPASQQLAGLVIPSEGQGKKQIVLRWNDYVHDGIWIRRNEVIAEPAMPEDARPGRAWFAVHVGITRSAPIELTTPEAMLVRQATQQLSKQRRGTLRGRFVFAGQRPKTVTIKPPIRRYWDARERRWVEAGKFDSDQALRDGKVADESLVIGKDGGIANIFVWALNAKTPPPLPAVGDARLKIKNGHFQPHALAMRSHQKLVIANDSEFGVNARFQTTRQPPINVLVPRDGGRFVNRFAQTELPISIHSSIQPWLNAWLLVRDDPYFAVSKQDGTFEINNLPTGAWQFQLWHEKGGRLNRDAWPEGQLHVTIDERVTDLGTITLTRADFDLPAQPATVDMATVGGLHPVWQAALALDRDGLLKLLHGDSQLVNRPDEEGFFPLHRAASGGHVKPAKLLLDVGAAVAARQTKFGGTPLQYAAARGHADFCQLLLAHDAPIDAADVFGRTPLMWAVLQGKTDVVELLIESGANVNAQIVKNAPGTAGAGSTALHIAVKKEDKEIAELLLAHGADATVRTEAGQTAFDLKSSQFGGAGWFRKAPFPEIGFFQPDEIDRTYVRIAMHPPAIRELGASETQAAVLKQLGRWATQDFRDVKPNDHKARQAVWAKARVRVEGMLNEQQRQRLNQLAIQQRRHEVFSNPRLSHELDITAEQHQRIQDKWAEHLSRLKAGERAPDATAPRGLVEANNGRRDQKPLLVTGEQSYRLFWNEVRKILTGPQRIAFEKLRGPPVVEQPATR